MFFVAFFIMAVFLMYVFVPKGFVLYEGMRFPVWSFKMKRYPQNGLMPEKHSFGKHKRQYLIHYRPRTNGKNQNQVVVYIHGGGWQFGTPEMFRPNAQVLDEMGYHSFFLSHRRIPKHNIRSMKEDVANAMSMVRDIMSVEGISQKKVILGGVSSGANLAALFYFDKKIKYAAGFREEHFAGLFLMAPPLNLYGMWHSPTLLWLTGRRKSRLFQEASPINFLQKKEDIATLIVHPEKDGMVPLSSTESFVEKAKELGFVNIEFHVLSKMTHMDAASWCFKDHPSHVIVKDWLEKIQ